MASTASFHVGGAARFGIDVRRPEFWKAGLAVLEGQVQLFSAL